MYSSQGIAPRFIHAVQLSEKSCASGSMSSNHSFDHQITVRQGRRVPAWPFETVHPGFGLHLAETALWSLLRLDTLPRTRDLLSTRQIQCFLCGSRRLVTGCLRWQSSSRLPPPHRARADDAYRFDLALLWLAAGPGPPTAALLQAPI